MVAGDVDSSGFRPWRTGAGESIAAIVTTWLRDYPLTNPDLGAIVWLDNTEGGDEVARRVRAAEAGEDAATR